MFHFISLAIILALRFAPAAAEFLPTAPGPGDKFTEGGDCIVQWTPDDTGAWQKTNIQLMTGQNNPMTHLTTVGTVDGSDPTQTSFTFTCPKVNPHAPIYFLQFTAEGTKNVTWTGRWSIVDASGQVSDPENSKQPDGQPIPWGSGTLLEGGTPPPSTAPPGQLDGSKGPVDTSSLPSGSQSTGSSTSFPPTSPAQSSTQSIPPTTTSSRFVTTITTSSSLPSSPPSTGANANANSDDSDSALAFSMSPLLSLAAVLLGVFMI